MKSSYPDQMKAALFDELQKFIASQLPKLNKSITMYEVGYLAALTELSQYADVRAGQLK